jgi:hypothetical protein
MNMWRVGEDMGSKETDGRPLTAGGTIMSASAKATSGRLHSTLIGAYLSP